MILMYICWSIFSYLLGAVPFGYIIGKLNGVDVRTMGSGNIGATNVARTVGKGWGALSLLCDALKGFLPVWLFPLISERYFSFDGTALALICAVMAIAGHNWPIYLKFKGGKGVATSLGALTGLAPICAATALATWILVFLATRYVSVASISAALVAAIAAWFAYSGLMIPLALTVLAALVVLRHKPNIKRLLAGNESRFHFKK